MTLCLCDLFLMNILAINPWIYDFAAFDFWLKPYGFLNLLTYLKNHGVTIDYIDCLEKKISRDSFGRGKYYHQMIAKPDSIAGVPRYFKRYGITPAEFKRLLPEKKIDYILVSSSMTYWYPGIVDVIAIVKKRYPGVPVFLGGTYATLCTEQALEVTGCDKVFTNDSLGEFFDTIGIDFERERFYQTLPRYEAFQKSLDYVVLRTSWGCPFRCSFCAIGKLSENYIRIDPKAIIDYIDGYAKKSIKDFIFYDDALLYDQDYITGVLEGIAALNHPIRFHTPNAMHLRYVTRDIAGLLKKCNFTNPHFGLETLDTRLQKQWGNKVDTRDLTRAISFLKEAGFGDGEFSIYLLLGYPGQDLDTLRADVERLVELGAKISLAEFSPVPHTDIFAQFKDQLRDPLLHNNSLFWFSSDKKIEQFWEVKNFVRELNHRWAPSNAAQGKELPGT